MPCVPRPHCCRAAPSISVIGVAFRRDFADDHASDAGT